MDWQMTSLTELLDKAKQHSQGNEDGLALLKKEKF